MAKSAGAPLIEALKQGRPYTFTMDEGGDLASMRKAVRHGQTITIAPIGDPQEIQAGDMVMVRWAGWYIFHIVGQIREGKYLIVNSLGKENGWVEAQDILGRVTEVIEPEPRPDVPVMLDQLEAACRELIRVEQSSGEEADRLLGVVEELRRYAARIGERRWDEMPRSNRWSFAQNLWRFTRQARDPAVRGGVARLIDRGNGYVGLASGILALLESGETDWPY